jgi:hypothetical protein
MSPRVRCEAGDLELFVSAHSLAQTYAVLTRVDRLVELNDAHFQRVWPDGAERVVSPVSLAPPSSA